MKPLSDYSVGDIFYIGQNDFTVLDNDFHYRVIANDFYGQSTTFGETNDWRDSPIRNELLIRYYREELERYILPNNIIPMARFLVSLDGLNDYGVCEDRVSLLTASEYALYHEVLGLNSDYFNLWWLITPASTPSNGCNNFVCHVNRIGIPSWNSCGCYREVRPFFCLESCTLVSDEPWEVRDESLILNDSTEDIEIDPIEFQRGLRDLIGGDFTNDIPR